MRSSKVETCPKHHQSFSEVTMLSLTEVELLSLRPSRLHNMLQKYNNKPHQFLNEEKVYGYTEDY
jgi:hypothetical protein